MTFRHSLFVKYVTLIVVLVSVVLVVSSAVGFYFSSWENISQLEALQHEKALGAATRIELYVEEIEHQMAWTALPEAGADGVTLEQRRYQYLKLLHQAPAISELAWADRTGHEQLRVSRLALDVVGGGKDVSSAPYFEAARTGVYYGPVYFRKETEPYMTISRPAGGAARGVMAAEVNLKFVWQVVKRINAEKKGQAYVVNSDGTLIAHPDISLVLQKTSLASLPQVKAAVTGAGGASNIARDIKGGRVLSAAAPIPTLGWHVFVEAPLQEALAPLYASIWRTGILLIGSLILAVLASLLLARRMVRPIRALEAATGKLAAGELNQRIEVRTGDELEALAGQFNDMAAKLAQSYADLEKKVDQRTLELREALGQQTATAEILRVISRSPTDVQPVLNVVAQRAEVLCEGAAVVVYLREEGDFMRRAAMHGPLTSQIAGGIAIDRSSISGAALIDKKTVHVVDLYDARETYPTTWQVYESLLRPRGVQEHHSMIAVPLVKDGQGLGVIMVRRGAVQAFTDKQIALLRVFADQAVIAIENVRLFNEIREKGRQLEIANKHKSDFLANMSHELRTPLNAIIGFSEVLQDNMFGQLNEEQLDFIKDIHESGKHLLSLINDILDLSKVEAGRMELVVGEFDLPSAVSNALALVKERASRHRLRLTSEIDPALGSIRADERKLKQILLNLLSNAVKFTPEGGAVKVLAHPVEDGVEIAVADTGVGIAPEDREAVFEEFRQVGKDYTRKAEGTGLGLALTRRFVHLHGGHIRLESEVGRGSVFTVFIPTTVRAMEEAHGE